MESSDHFLPEERVSQRAKLDSQTDVFAHFRLGTVAPAKTPTAIWCQQAISDTALTCIVFY